MTDRLDPREATWARSVAPAPSITEAPAYWRRIAADERDPHLAADYLRLAEMTDRYLAMAGRATP